MQGLQLVNPFFSGIVGLLKYRMAEPMCIILKALDWGRNWQEGIIIISLLLFSTGAMAQEDYVFTHVVVSPSKDQMIACDIWRSGAGDYVGRPKSSKLYAFPLDRSKHIDLIPLVKKNRVSLKTDPEIQQSDQSEAIPPFNPSVSYSNIKATVNDNFELLELSTQAHIYTATLKPQHNEKWVNDCLNLSLDFEQFGCKIIAYRIQWFNGNWSNWFVPGVNDLYKKPKETLRRYWACFNDHSFEIIYQTPGQPIDFTNKKSASLQ